MMNGKKSYLISFTALFSRKGYELTIGFEQIINANNQYHLTAPVNSTYRTLIEDTMKSTNKVPHSATGLFGRLGSAGYVTQYDGFEAETVVASIVSYLSGIHKYFNGETIPDVTTEEQQNVRRLEQLFDAEGTGGSKGSRTNHLAHLEEMVSGDLYDVKVYVAEGKRFSISLSNKQSAIHALESNTLRISADAQISGFDTAENGVRLNAEEGRAVLSNIVRTILNGEIVMLNTASHDPNITMIGEASRFVSADVGMYRADGESHPLEYAIIVSEGKELGYELTEISASDSSLKGFELADTRQAGTFEKIEESRWLEVTEDAFLAWTETAISDMALDAKDVAYIYAEKQDEAELTLTTLTDTYGGGDADVNESIVAETLYHEPTIPSEFIMVDVSKDTHLQTFTQVYTYQNVDVQEFLQTDTVMLASQEDTMLGDLIQPIYNGDIDEMFTLGETVYDSTLYESIAYETLVHDPAHLGIYSESTPRKGVYSMELSSQATKHVKDARIETTQTVDKRVKANLQEFLTYETRQDGQLETIEVTDSHSDSLLTIDRISGGETRQEGGVISTLESGRVEMDYDARTDGLEQSRYFDKNVAITFFTSVTSIANGDENRLDSAEYTSDTWGNESITRASMDSEAEGRLEFSPQAVVNQTYATDLGKATHADLLMSNSSDIQLVTNAEIYVGGDPLVDRFMSADHVSDLTDAELEEMTNAEVTERTQAEVQTLVTFEQIQGVIAESPEILKTVRLMEIMYGSKAVDLIEAGMNNIIQDSLSQGFTRADFPSITQAVIERLKQAGAGVTVVANNQDQIQAEHNKGAELTVEDHSTGRYINEPEGTVPEQMSGASLFDFHRTADVAEISRAISEANKHIGVIQTMESVEQTALGEGSRPDLLTAAETDITKDSVVHLLENALSDPTAEGVIAGIETGSASMEYDGVLESLEKADRVTSATGVMQETVTAEQTAWGEGARPDPLTTAATDITKDSVVHLLENALSDPTAEGVIAGIETGSVGMEYDGVMESLETADHVTSAEGVMQETVTAEQSDAKHVGYEHNPETAFNDTGREGILFGIESAELGTDNEAVTLEIEGARISDVNSPSILHKMEGAWQSDVARESVVHELESATYDDGEYTMAETKLERATQNKSADAVLSEIEGATYFTSEEAVVLGLESADYFDGSTEGVISGGESAYLDDSSKVGTISERETATLTTNAEAIVHRSEQATSGKVINADIQEEELADYSSYQNESVIDELDSATRKRKQLVTDIHADTESVNNREPIETLIAEPEDATRPTRAVEVGIEMSEEADRPKRVIEVDINKAEDATRPKREIETTVERPEGGILKTPEEPKKPRIWLILGKIASWSIWNWKKTR
ncbi:hypothetical protein M3629_09005 [Paenibacillus polysaccharolyticus]|uniref:hypothetical protein n=1 Tax=Paenibacillus polysaccharolyticus TaxID=582692 RepID=UPI00204134FC|nr:hypothetical protein [Paenibacillus polysaccharolyticus]MCM3132923.1 hypothetical protein [Paenibacillus polysaccharolyticus]